MLCCQWDEVTKWILLREIVDDKVFAHVTVDYEVYQQHHKRGLKNVALQSLQCEI